MLRLLWFFIVFLCAGLTLVACSGLAVNDPSGISAGVPVGSMIRFYEQIPIPPDRERVWFKGDGLSTGAGSYGAVCAIEVREIDATRTQYVEPGELRIYKVQELWREVVQRRRSDARVGFRLASYGAGDGSPLVVDGFHFWLDSKEHPNVTRLTCVGIFDDISEGRPPTLAEIRASLGSYASLEVARDG
jgi:hypothetical protein